MEISKFTHENIRGKGKTISRTVLSKSFGICQIENDYFRPIYDLYKRSEILNDILYIDLSNLLDPSK